MIGQLKIGTAIPSGVVVTVIGGKVVAYVGVGGGVYKPPTDKHKKSLSIDLETRFLKRNKSFYPHPTPPPQGGGAGWG